MQRGQFKQGVFSFMDNPETVFYVLKMSQLNIMLPLALPGLTVDR
ncbi:hypothetical protein [Salinisphaera sp. G21_0]|nr:hypothetical protein [Salinisphaera sp. G21_0]